LDHNEIEGEAMRHHLPFGPQRMTTGFMSYPKATVPLSQLLQPMELDELTVAGDERFSEKLGRQRNLPSWIKDELQQIY
jgi:hypothetical protein